MKITKSPDEFCGFFQWREVPRTAEGKEGCNYRRLKHLIGFRRDRRARRSFCLVL